MGAAGHVLHRRDGESGLVAGMAACTGIRTVIELKKPHLHLRFRNRL
jgi:hypothetical protein